jgi:hypothetical protein
MLWTDDVRVADSTPVECARLPEAARPSDLAGWARPATAPTKKTTPSATRTSTKPTTPRPTATKSSSSVYYENCTAVRAAGAAPSHRGEPGYSSKLDRDGDGIACEN